MPDSFQPVAKISDIPAKKCRNFLVGGHDVLVVHTTEGFFAVDNVCSHAYAKLNEGRLRGFRVICPLHRAAFDVRDGSVLGAPANAPIRSFPVRVVGDTLEVSVD